MAFPSGRQPATVMLPHRAMRNIYVRELGRGYLSLGIQPIFGEAYLFESDLIPDILHLHWPEEVYRSLQDGGFDEHVDRFLARLDRLRASGTRIVWTVHNLKPHEIAMPAAEHRAYQGVIDRAHVIHHHCPLAERTLRSEYRIPGGQTHIIVPHGHYASYANTMTRAEARAALGLDASAFVFLHFGQIRAYKGLDLVERAFDRARVARKHLVVAGGVDLSLSRAGRLRFFARRKLARRISHFLDAVWNDDVQRFLNACDAVVLGHTAGLNSGVAVLAMTFGKPVVGPRLGCIEWVLEQGANVLYPPGDAAALARAMESASGLDLAACAETNRSVAASWSWDAIASRAVAACSGTAIARAE
jgi:glycosyltransferase involved in cell wall biosynthesis